MTLPANSFLKKIKENPSTFGIWNNFPNPLIMEVLAGAGFDWVLIDAEHGPFDLSTILPQLQAIAAYDTALIVRPPSGDPVFIKRLLDMGVQTFLVPMVNSAQEAAELVRCMRYPPAGNRGIGAALGRASQWNRIDDYLVAANENMCLIVQVETKGAYEQLDEILAVEGVNGVFFGPADLSASLGYVGQMEHPQVVEIVENGLERTRAAGKIAGTISLSIEGAKHYEKCGANMIGVGADALLFAGAARHLAAQFRS
jgi:4-hydroxy-2-oxoheptanedioate aldolase